MNYKLKQENVKGKYVELIEENLERAVIGRNRLENI